MLLWHDPHSTWDECCKLFNFHIVYIPYLTLVPPVPPEAPRASRKSCQSSLICVSSHVSSHWGWTVELINFRSCWFVQQSVFFGFPLLWVSSGCYLSTVLGSFYIPWRIYCWEREECWILGFFILVFGIMRVYWRDVELTKRHYMNTITITTTPTRVKALMIWQCNFGTTIKIILQNRITPLSHDLENHPLKPSLYFYNAKCGHYI